jgi:hypothetical protein
MGVCSNRRGPEKGEMSRFRMRLPFWGKGIHEDRSVGAARASAGHQHGGARDRPDAACGSVRVEQLSMSRLILALTLAVALTTGTAVVVAVQPTPALACNGGSGC